MTGGRRARSPIAWNEDDHSPHHLGDEGMRRALAPWPPYAGLVDFHLLQKHLDERGS